MQHKTSDGVSDLQLHTDLYSYFSCVDVVTADPEERESSQFKNKMKMQMLRTKKTVLQII